MNARESTDSVSEGLMKSNGLQKKRKKEGKKEIRKKEEEETLAVCFSATHYSGSVPIL